MTHMDFMADACTLADAGFHFEEGGCFAMAVALGRAMVEDGHDPRLAFSPKALHAFVEVDGDLYDHAGRVSGRHEVDYVTEDRMRELAKAHGHDYENFEIDLAAAYEIIQSARGLEDAQARLTGWMAENIGYCDNDARELFDHLRHTDNAVYIWHVVGSDFMFAALEQGSPAQNHTMSKILNQSTVELVRKAFETEGGGQGLRTLIEQVKENGVWAAANDLAPTASPSGYSPKR